MDFDIAAFVGTWQLVASTSINDEIAFVDDRPDPDGVEHWLVGHGLTLAASATAATGLTLRIAADGRFSEHLSGAPKMPWYDADGVLTDTVEPFDAVMVSNGAHLFLQPARRPAGSTPIERSHGAAVLRLDDGDTHIAERLDVAGNTLVRTVNAVTDGLYLDRVVIVYARQ